MALFEAIFRD
ncbi:hypothetical protein CGCFRS4_v016152 [Colletotrichum fructicola]|nr:hypothetical protein CGCFRS4_v016152 [Colletotrichum fructicola]